MTLIDSYFRDVVFGPPEKQAEFPDRWPTMQELQQRKKQSKYLSSIIIFLSLLISEVIGSYFLPSY